MPLLHGHHGQRHHLISSMRTKEFLKLYYPYLIHDHTILFNTRDIDLDATPPDDLLDFIQQLRGRAPEGAPLTILSRKQSEEIDSSSASVFHQQLVAANRLEDAAKFLSLQGVKNSCSPSIPAASAPVSRLNFLTKNTSPLCALNSLRQSAEE